MSLEQKIEELTKAVVALTAVIQTTATASATIAAPETKQAAEKQPAKAKETKAAAKKEEPAAAPEPEETKTEEVTYDMVIQSFIKLYEKDKQVNGDTAPICMDILNKLNIKGRDGGPPKISYVEESRYAEAYGYILEGMAKFETSKKDVSFV